MLGSIVNHAKQGTKTDRLHISLHILHKNAYDFSVANYGSLMDCLDLIFSKSVIQQNLSKPWQLLSYRGEELYDLDALIVDGKVQYVHFTFHPEVYNLFWSEIQSLHAFWIIICDGNQ